MTQRNPELNGMLDYEDEGLDDFLDQNGGETGRSTTVGSTTLQRLLRRNAFQEHIMTPASSENVGNRMESVLSGNVSPVQRLRFGFPTVAKTKEDVGFLHPVGSERKTTTEDNGVHTGENLRETFAETHQSSGSRDGRNDAVSFGGGKPP